MASGRQGLAQSGRVGLGCVVIVVLVLAAIGAAVYFIGKAGVDIIAEQVKVDIRDNPVILEHLGNLQTLELDLKATAAASGEDVYVFQATGTKGKGEIRATVVTVSDTERVKEGTLRLESGATHDLFPGGRRP